MDNFKHIGDKDEPHFYMAFVLKGNADQYLDLLKYVKKQNGAKLIYQNKSLTYLYVSNQDPKQTTNDSPQPRTKVETPITT